MIRRFWLLTLSALIFLSASMSHSTLTRASSPVALTLWHIEDADTMNRLGIQKIFDDWAAVNAPGSTLTMVAKQVDDLVYDLESGNGSPDLIWTVPDQISTLASKNKIQALDDRADMSVFLPSLVTMARYNGKSYGLPIQADNTILLLYNKKFVSQAPQTFEELMTMAQEIQKNAAEDFIPFAYDQEDSFWIFPIAHAFQASAFAADGKTPALDSAAWIQTYQFIYDLKFKAKIEPLICLYVCADHRFRTEKAAMILNGDWMLRGADNYADLLGDDLGVAPLPSVGQDPAKDLPASFINGRYLMIAADTQADKLTVAQAFARFLATDTATSLSWTVANHRLPALLAALNDDQITHNAQLEPVRASLLRGLPRPMGYAMDCIMTAITVELRKLINDSTKPADAAANAQKAAQDCLTAQPS